MLDCPAQGKFPKENVCTLSSIYGNKVYKAPNMIKLIFIYNIDADGEILSSARAEGMHLDLPKSPSPAKVRDEQSYRSRYALQLQPVWIKV